MELLLNLMWVMLAVLGVCAFLRGRRSCTWAARVPYAKALLALACILVLLFPVVSASDDLHPTQAVLEDATRRIQHLVAPLQHAQRTAPTGVLPAMLPVCIICSLIVLQWRQPDAQAERVKVRARIPHAGRAPPSL